MEITEVRIKLMEDTDDRLQGFCSVTFDNCFVVRDLKIIEGTNGPFVAMPSRKLTAHCPQCGCKNHLRAAYCNQCGARLKEDLTVRDQEGRAKLYADIAHPINSACREMIQKRVIQEYRTEQERASRPDYVSRYDDYYGEETERAAETPRVHRTAKPETTEASSARDRARMPKGNRVEGAELEPRPPHRRPPHQDAEDARDDQTRQDDFGAGIF